MNAEANRRKCRVFTRRLIVLPALVVSLSVALTGVASASMPFKARVTFTGTRPFSNAGGCSNGAFDCGMASITGYGSATWDWYINSFTPGQPCSSYGAVAVFTLLSDGSTLTLDENGLACTPGNSGVSQPPGPPSFGHPSTATGSWTVDPHPALNTGQFAGLTGAGTDSVSTAGAHSGGSYIGTLS